MGQGDATSTPRARLHVPAAECASLRRPRARRSIQGGTGRREGLASFAFGHAGVRLGRFIATLIAAFRAFSDEVDTGSSKKMRPNKKLERRSNFIGSKCALGLWARLASRSRRSLQPSTACRIPFTPGVGARKTSGACAMSIAAAQLWRFHRSLTRVRASDWVLRMKVEDPRAKPGGAMVGSFSAPPDQLHVPDEPAGLATRVTC